MSPKERQERAARLYDETGQFPLVLSQKCDAYVTVLPDGAPPPKQPLTYRGQPVAVFWASEIAPLKDVGAVALRKLVQERQGVVAGATPARSDELEPPPPPPPAAPAAPPAQAAWERQPGTLEGDDLVHAVLDMFSGRMLE